MESELLPCPFCGESSAVVVERTPLQFKVFCGNGPCSVSTAIWGARQPAIAAWNRRRAPSEREKPDDCPDCKRWVAEGTAPPVGPSASERAAALDAALKAALYLIPACEFSRDLVEALYKLATLRKKS